LWSVTFLWFAVIFSILFLRVYNIFSFLIICFHVSQCFDWEAQLIFKVYWQGWKYCLVQFWEFFSFLFLIGIFGEELSVIDFCSCFKKVIFEFQAIILLIIFICFLTFLFTLLEILVCLQFYGSLVEKINFQWPIQKVDFKRHYF